MNIERFRKIFVGLEERFGYHIANYEEGNGKKSGDLLLKLSPYFRNVAVTS